MVEKQSAVFQVWLVLLVLGKRLLITKPHELYLKHGSFLSSGDVAGHVR